MGRWTATSPYDIYMVDTPKEDNGDQKDTAKDKRPGQKPKRRQRHRSKSSHSKNSDKSARKNDTLVDSKGNNMNPAMEQEEPGHVEQTPDHSDPEGRTHQTTSEEEDSPVDDAFIIPEKRLEQDNLRRRLMAMARSLKKQKQRLKAAQDTLN